MKVYCIQAIKVNLSLGSRIVELDPLAWCHESILHLSHVIPQIHGPDLLMQEKISRKNLNTKENHHWLELLILTMFWKIKRIEKVPKLKASTRHAELMQCDILSWVLKHIKDKSGKTVKKLNRSLELRELHQYLFICIHHGFMEMTLCIIGARGWIQA